MTLRVDVEHVFPGFRLHACFEADGGVTALFGASGAGKTTLVHGIAGLLRPARGAIAIDGEPVLDTERGLFVPAHRRRVGMVFQDARLLPHLTVRQNLRYGRWFAARGRAGPELDAIVGLLGLEPLLARRPGKLSGGERQRVAIGRALLAVPRLLLMDEPLAALDLARRAEILPYLERLRDEVKVPIVYVSHTLAEVTRLATRVVLIGDGQVQAVGPVSEVLSRLDLLPFTGLDDAGALVRAPVEALEPAHGLARLRCCGGELRVAEPALAVGSELRVRIRARDVIVARERPGELSALNVLQGRIAEIGAPRGATVTLRLQCGEDSLLAEITRLSCERLALAPGLAVYAIVKSAAIDRTPLTAQGDRGSAPAAAAFPRSSDRDR